MEPNSKHENAVLQEVAELRAEVARLQQENNDLQLTLLATSEHGDTVESELQATNRQLQSEILQRRKAHATLQDILETVLKDKADLELILEATATHGDTLEYQLYTQAVETMRQSEELFRAISESTPILMILTQRLDGAIAFANSTSIDQLGINAQDLQNYYLRDFLVHPGDERRLIERFRAEGSVKNEEIQVKRANGEDFWVSASVHPLRLGKGETLLTTLYDISSRKQAEASLLNYQQLLEQQAQDLEERVEQRTAELRQAEEMYRSIFENAVEGIYQVSPQGKYLSANPALAEILGYASAEELMETVTNLDSQIYVQPMRRFELIAYLKRYDSVSDFESEVYRKDGGIIWVSENVRSIVGGDGEIICFEGSVQNITHRRRTEDELRRHRRRTEQLLLNILPQPIAERLKQEEKTIVDSFSHTAVMFADIVNFTAISSKLSPEEVVELLNSVFSTFDQLAELKRVEKVKTIGDAYMVVGGVPRAIEDPAGAMADMALAMQKVAQTFPPIGDQPITLRIGIHLGPVTAGIIGVQKFSYDLWGDTVNVASRMEMLGEPGRIQVTETLFEELRDRYRFEERGWIEVKGKGLMKTYWLVGKIKSYQRHLVNPAVSKETPSPRQSLDTGKARSAIASNSMEERQPNGPQTTRDPHTTIPSVDFPSDLSEYTSDAF
jgi:PAS domain S-box-containing protein